MRTGCARFAHSFFLFWKSVTKGIHWQGKDEQRANKRMLNPAFASE